MVHEEKGRKKIDLEIDIWKMDSGGREIERGEI